MSVSAIQTFRFDNWPVRTASRDGEPWFVAKDVCEIFGDSHYLRSVGRLGEDEKGYDTFDTPGGKQDMVTVNEPGLYSLLFGMQPQLRPGMDEAAYNARVEGLKRFKRWITHEVLPQIRQTGSYSLPKLPTHLETAKALVAALEQIEAAKPAVDFYQAVASADNAQPIAVVAKILNLPGVGRNNLFKLLRQRGILMDNGLPYQQHIAAGRFEVKEKVIQMGDQDILRGQTYVTGKGLQWLQQVLAPKGEFLC